MAKKKDTSPQELPSFEEALEELESIVAKMEQGDMSLEASLEAFERGVSLTRHCQQALKEAEQKVSILVENMGKDEIAEFRQ